MLNSQQLKSLGLRFARALQMTVKTAVLFTVDHNSVERPIQSSFQFLNNLLKEAGQFTFGFVDNQVVLNNLLTTDTSIQQLQTEFLKRGIAAVTFEPGLTLARYKKVVGLLSVPTKNIDEAGGILRFLDQNELEGARIIPAARNQKKDEHGDTIIESDSESYILSKQMAEEEGPRDLLDSIDALMESACFDPAMRTEVLSDFASRAVDDSSYGVPIGMPNLVLLKDGEAVTKTGQSGSSAEGPSGGEALAGQGGAAFATAAGATDSVGAFARPNSQTGSGEGDAAGPLSSMWGGQGTAGTGSIAASPPTGSEAHGIAPAPGTGIHTSAGRGAPGGPGRGTMTGGPWTSGSGSFIELVEKSVQRSLMEEKGDPKKSYSSLAKILRNMGVDKILDHFPEDRRQELTSMPPEQLAAEYIEDTALQIAGTRLKSASEAAQPLVVEEEVVRVLARSLQATHMADRLAQKLAKFIQEFAVPPHVQEKIREELHWSSLSASRKYDLLMGITHYSSVQFRRVMDLLRDLVTQREIDHATALASHYFEFLDQEHGQIDITELSRAPELIRSIPLAHLGFAAKTAERLSRALLREDISDFIHSQAASALTVLAQSVVAFEDFQDVLAIGLSLEVSVNRSPEKHKKCCGLALTRLLPAAALERIIELFLQKRGDSAWAKTAGTLLRFAAPVSVESVFNHIISEEDTRNRLALLRLVPQLGKGATEVAYKYLSDERWYVVRNMCGILAELRDADIAEHIVPALQHSDLRVQQAALKALIKSRAPGRATVLAGSLANLAPSILDEALDELMFLKDSGAVQGLEDFVNSSRASSVSLRKAVQALACIPSDDALQSLARLARREQLDPGLRRFALGSICRTQSPLTVQLLEEISALRGSLADEARAELKRRQTTP